MKKQTAVEWLVQQVNEDCLNSTFIRKELIEEAKAMELEQIVDAWDEGNYAYFYSKKTGIDFENGQEYYNEKYGQLNNK